MYPEIRQLLKRGKYTAEEIINMIELKNEELRTKIQYTKLLYSAKMNLQSSKVLYEKEIYADSFNLFIQSVEKIGKVFEIFIARKTLSENELKRKIGHEIIRFYERRAHEQADKYKLVKTSLKEDPELGNKFNKLKEISFFKDVDLDKVSNSINSFLSHTQTIRKNRKDLIYISEKDLNEFINTINKYYKEFKNYELMSYKKFSEVEWKEFKESMKKWYELEEGELSKDEEDIFEKMILQNEEIYYLIGQQLIRIYLIYVSILGLSIITLHHYEITKYPDSEDYDLWPVIYTEELPIIIKLPELFKIILYEFNELKKMA